MKKVFIILVGLVLSQTIMAGKITPITKITNIFTYSKAAVIKIANKHNNEYGCTNSKAREYLYIDLTKPESKSIYSAILTAFVSGSKIRLAYNGCVSWGATSVPNIYRVDMIK